MRFSGVDFVNSASIDYKALGQRIRQVRIKNNLTQYTLAELSDLAPPNISHIERGVTKLSLPSLVNIANALEVSLDELLCDSLKESKRIYVNGLAEAVEDCDEKELRILTDIFNASKDALRKYGN